MVPDSRVNAAIGAFGDMTLTPHLLTNLCVKINEVVRILDFPELIQLRVNKLFHTVQPHHRQWLQSLPVFSCHSSQNSVNL